MGDSLSSVGEKRHSFHTAVWQEAPVAVDRLMNSSCWLCCWYYLYMLRGRKRSHCFGCVPLELETSITAVSLTIAQSAHPLHDGTTIFYELVSRSLQLLSEATNTGKLTTKN